ncbi:MAG: NUDIX hydrolase [Arachnia sp.]
MIRPIKHRRAARVIVLAAGRVLLECDTDPGVPGSAWWVTPGGGRDPAESAVAAAVRELHEEAGLELPAARFSGPVASRRTIHGYSDRVLVQDEDFFVVEVEPFVPEPLRLTESELNRLVALDWFEIDRLPAIVWPHNLADIISGQAPMDLGEMFESTLALTEADVTRVRLLPQRVAQHRGGGPHDEHRADDGGQRG